MVKKTPGINTGRVDPNFDLSWVFLIFFLGIGIIVFTSVFWTDRSMDQAEPDIKRLEQSVQKMNRQVEEMTKELNEIEKLSDEIARRIVEEQGRLK